MEPNLEPRPEPRPDRGFSLTEVLIAVVVTGTLVAATVSAIFTSVTTSSRSFTAAQVETVLLNASDLINRAPQRCDYDQYVNAAAQAEGWDPSQISVTTERLIANTGNATTDWELQPCPAEVAAFQVQRLTITLTDPTGRVTKNLTVVKSDVS